MGRKLRERLYGPSIRASAERAREARKAADKLACEAWNMRMLGYQGTARPSPTLGDALNAGYRYLEVRCLGCDTHQTVALDIVRRSKATPIHELERYTRCEDCSRVRGYPYKRGHLVALRATKISASDPRSTWWPGAARHLTKPSLVTSATRPTLLPSACPRSIPMESPMTDKWVLTWARAAFITISRKSSARLRERLEFDSEKGAINFAMDLDDPQRQTVQLYLPNGDIADLPVIERMYAAQK